MVNAAITEYPELWRAAINYYGIADFITLLEAHRPLAPRPSRPRIRRPGTRTRALFDRISPIRHIDRVQAPLLLLHGGRDPRVPLPRAS